MLLLSYFYIHFSSRGLEAGGWDQVQQKANKNKLVAPRQQSLKLSGKQGGGGKTCDSLVTFFLCSAKSVDELPV